LFRTTTGGQRDDDGNGLGNACDIDYNGDGVSDFTDETAITADFGKDLSAESCNTFRTTKCDVLDRHGKGRTVNSAALDFVAFPEKCESCPLECVGDMCDDDGDGVVNRNDNCVAVPNPKQCDTDHDGDGVINRADNCTRVANPRQCDTDRDGYGNACDGDFDQNGRVDTADFNGYFAADLASGVDSGRGTDMNCDGKVDDADYTGYFV